MKKLYTEELQNGLECPKKETVSFLLNYSRSIGVVRNKRNRPVMFHLN